MKEYRKTNEEGITLVALIVTIVVLLILAGITITYVMGDNSIFKKASDAKLKTEIAKWQERLETAKTPIIIDGLGKFDPDKYFDYIEKQGIIEDKETDVVDNGNGRYDVTVKAGYIFEVELIPSQDNPKDAKIEYIGQAGKIVPIIKRIETSATSTSITGKATVVRLGNGTVTYYYKLKSEADSEYKEIADVNSEIGATVTEGIVAGTEYVIKVVAKNEVGETADTVEIRATKTFVEGIILNKTETAIKVGNTETLIVTIKPDDATNKNVIWESSNTEIAIVDENGVITGKKVGAVTITVKATDGSNKSATCTLIVKSINLNKETTTIKEGKTETLIATVLPANATNKNVIWISSDENIATVNSDGVVTGISVGTAIITASTTDINKLTSSCTVTVLKSSSLAKIVGQQQTSNNIVYDDYNNKVVVPGGFKVVPNGIGEVTYKYSEYKDPNVQDGVVIQDNEGNEFVWIPVGTIKNKDNTTTTITLGRYTFASDGTPTLKQNATKYSSAVTIDSWLQELTSDSGNIAAKSLQTFVSKTNANGGFYLGRYEASYKDSTHCYSKNTSSIRTSSTITLRSGMLWNFITQPNAATIARNSFTSSYVESDLVNSYAWDTAIVYIQKYSGKTNYASIAGRTISVGLGNTGNPGDRVCNIYDMASNCSEWSTEHSNLEGNPCVFRGGTCFYPDWHTCFRSTNTTSDAASNISFRPLIYIK